MVQAHNNASKDKSKPRSRNSSTGSTSSAKFMMAGGLQQRGNTKMRVKQEDHDKMIKTKEFGPNTEGIVGCNDSLYETLMAEDLKQPEFTGSNNAGGNKSIIDSFIAILKKNQPASSHRQFCSKPIHTGHIHGANISDVVKDLNKKSKSSWISSFMQPPRQMQMTQNYEPYKKLVDIKEENQLRLIRKLKEEEGDKVAKERSKESHNDKFIEAPPNPGKIAEKRECKALAKYTDDDVRLVQELAECSEDDLIEINPEEFVPKGVLDQVINKNASFTWEERK